jgi:hypothetical protein
MSRVNTEAAGWAKRVRANLRFLCPFKTQAAIAIFSPNIESTLQADIVACLFQRVSAEF